jgi:putative phosphoesterase
MAGLLICSDIHGDAISAKKIVDAFESHKAERLVILGDILYHGPRNDLPAGYAPKKVIEILNPYSDKILAVRGNCDAEVDQMVLSFPILADYAFIERDGLRFFATHGHVHNIEKCPPLMKGDVLLHGHTHVQTCTPFGNENFYINPGSISLPKEGNPKTYMVYENRSFTLKDFGGNTLWEKKL